MCNRVTLRGQAGFGAIAFVTRLDTVFFLLLLLLLWLVMLQVVCGQHGAATGGNDKYEREEEGVFGPVS